MQKLFIVLLCGLASCAVIDDAQHVKNEANDFAYAQAHAFKHSTTISDTYTALKDGIVQDTYPAREIVAGAFLPEMEEEIVLVNADGDSDLEVVTTHPVSKVQAPHYTVIEREDINLVDPEAEAPIKLGIAAYCYKSLADVTCYKTRQKGQDFRLIR